MLKQYLEVGKIVGTHGIKGDLKVEPWCDSPEFICRFKTLYLKNGNEPKKVLSAKVHKTMTIIRLEGINSIEKADALRGSILYLNRNDTNLEKNVYFIQDIIGLSVKDIDNGTVYGTVSEVIKTGANDVYEITAENGTKYLIPVIDEVVINTDVEKGIMEIRPIKGIFDDED